MCIVSCKFTILSVLGTRNKFQYFILLSPFTTFACTNNICMYMEKYNFDEIIDRRGTDCVKWDGMKEHWGTDSLEAMWVADMDFRTPPFIIESIRKRLEHEVLGYTMPHPRWGEAITGWLGRRHGWKVDEDKLLFLPGLVRGLAYVVHCFTSPGDRVMVMDPVYHPFFLVTRNTGREAVFHRLDIRDGRFEIDFDRFERDVQGCRLFVLSNPHNPGGRVWSADELERMAEICHRSGTLVVSDEIHADMTLPGYLHTVFATVSDAARDNSLVLMSPSKAFNMPGLASSYAVICNDGLRKRFAEYMEAGEFDSGHMFAYAPVVAAYEQGEEWLRQMLEYVQGNIDYVQSYLREHIPSIGMMRPEASFLVFLDCRGLGLTQDGIEDLFARKAGLALNSGTMFGTGGEGFMRMNVACPRSRLVEAMERLGKALH